ncbi:MAG: hypothetical protein ACLSGI_11335 [Butyricicoccaceae bacterium]
MMKSKHLQPVQCAEKELNCRKENENEQMINLQLFADPNTNTTTQTGTGQEMSPQMKTFYKVISKCGADLVHDQFDRKSRSRKTAVKQSNFAA